MFDVAEVWRTMAHDVTPISIAECGHLCQEEQPEFVNTQILDFLEGYRRQSNA
jgi:pimeloyl-ACP methyl ester carboxylesterase